MTHFIPKKVHPSWKEFIKKESIISELEKIHRELNCVYFPTEENVLRFLENDLNKIKCIIVGMEPYPTSWVENNAEVPMATGRSFEVSILKNKDWNYKIKQSSIRNILKTIYYNETGYMKSLEKIRDEINSNKFQILTPSELFDNLEQQGVLFLNATLTVEKEKVGSHERYWETFMNELIKYILLKNHNVKWLLWGVKAKERIASFVSEENIVYSKHPRLSEFIEENCFQHIKDIVWVGKKQVSIQSN